MFHSLDFLSITFFNDGQLRLLQGLRGLVSLMSVMLLSSQNPSGQVYDGLQREHFAIIEKEHSVVCNKSDWKLAKSLLL
jgi:hypothetical protein